jgi:endonuclease III related protein
MSHISTAFELLSRHYGEPPRPVGDSLWERLIGGLLAQQATPERAERALGNLREAGIRDAKSLADADVDELMELIAPAGAAKTKAGRLRNVARHLMAWAEREGAGADVEALAQLDTPSLRELLAAVNGISRATADGTVLDVFERPVFPAERAAHRVLKRHGWLDFDADDEMLGGEVESGLDREADRLRRFHVWLGQVGRDYCGQTPRCDGCPLQPLLPASGPLEPEA